MANEQQWSVDLRTNNGLWARFAAWFMGGRLVVPEQGKINGETSAHGRLGTYDISDMRAMQVSAVWACVRIIATVTSQLPIELYKHTSAGKQQLDPSHPLYRLLKIAPNQYMSPLDFRKAMNTQLALFGNAYAYIERNSEGTVISLMPLQAPNVAVMMQDNRLFYRVSSEKGDRDIPAERIFHLKGIGTTGLFGLSPIANASRTLGVTIAMEDQQGDFYANGAKTPKVLLAGDKVLSAQQRTQLAENFAQIAKGPIDERLWVLEAGMKPMDVQISASDAQTLESRKFQVNEIARIFGVPPYLIGDVEKSTSWGSGIEQQNLAFIQYTLMDYLKSWESSIQRTLVIDKEKQTTPVEAQHNLEMLLRGDSKARAEFLSKMVASGIYTINEARHQENLPPVPGGDKNRTQIQNQPITEAPSIDGASSQE